MAMRLCCRTGFALRWGSGGSQKIPWRSRTPTWDIASTCTVSGQAGLLLVEAKAHSKELSSRSRCGATPANRKQIENALQEADAGLSTASGGSWRLFAEHKLQLANRFAWTWKLATFGVPVVLLYLGFLDAVEKKDMGNRFENLDDWKSTLSKHCQGVIDVA